MDPPQWNYFQPPVTEPIMDYNRSYNTLSQSHSNSSNFSSQSSASHYNGYYDQSSNNSHMRAPSKPMSSMNSMASTPSYSNSSSNNSPYSYMNNTSKTSIGSSYGSNRNAEPLRQQQQQQQQQPPPPQQQQQQQPSSNFSNYYSSNNSSSQSQYTPPPSDFQIGTFTLNAKGFPSEGGNNHETSNSNQTNSSYQSNSSSTNGSAANQSARETGIIEKLLQTYGFIQCCERQARLFFHFSQFDGNTEHLRIGDPVEFEVTFDRRTGKPIASSVTKISPEVMSEVLSEERVIGIVTTELKSEHSGGEQQGRITYENRGECFFLPYSKEDVEGYVVLKPGDRVSFQIATNQRHRNGNLAARHARLENPAEPVKYQGVVSAIKDSYGFIERADVVDEIFFHFSEAKTIPEGLKLGDDVEFLIQSRNGKEVATNMVRLPAGTVVFEDINVEEIRGQVLKPVEKTLRQNQKDPLTGRIRYRGKDRSEVEVKFGERDQKADFTLRHGDWVKFNIATDRRDSLQKATNISLLDESFKVSGEKREEGLIHSIKDGFGYIKCADRDSRMYFQFNEILDPHWKISVNDEVEFTVCSDGTSTGTSRYSATRIQKLATGTVKFEVLVQDGLEGEVTTEPTAIPVSPSFDISEQSPQGYQPGIIAIMMAETPKQTINYYPVEGQMMPRLGDRVQFSCFLVKRTKERVASNIKILPPVMNSVTPGAARQNLVGSGRTFERDHRLTTRYELYAMKDPPEQQQKESELNKKFFPNNSKFQSGSIDNNGVITPPADLTPALSTPEMMNDDSSFFGSPSVNMIQTSNPPTPSTPTVVEDLIDLSDQTPPKPIKKAQSPTPLIPPSSPLGLLVAEPAKPLVPELTLPARQSHSSKNSRSFPVHQGFIATLKDSFGFIETINHDKEIFFHYSNLETNVHDLELGQEVEYTISSRTGPGGKLSAENVHTLPVGTIATPKVLGEVFEGTVLRSMRSANPEQQEYCGQVCVGKEDEKLGRHQFGITGLINKKELLQPGDLVNFQLDEDGWAINIRAVRKKLLATVEAVKGAYGFLNYDNDEGKKLFFHQSEVKDGITLTPGDEVQFNIITNLKTGKSSACNITRMLASTGPSQRPDRLVSRLKGLSKDTSKRRIEVIRQPKGPDGSKGFKFQRGSS